MDPVRPGAIVFVAVLLVVVRFRLSWCGAIRSDVRSYGAVRFHAWLCLLRFGPVWSGALGCDAIMIIFGYTIRFGARYGDIR